MLSLPEYINQRLFESFVWSESGASIYESAAFTQQLIRKIAMAQKRVFMKGMTFEFDHQGYLLAHALEEAVLRGVPVIMEIDNYANRVSGDVPNFLSRISDGGGVIDHTRRATFEGFNRMRSIGLDLRINNAAGLFNKFAPVFLGRDHRKVIVVDNQVCLGDFNFSQQIAIRHSAGIWFEDKQMADYLLENQNVKNGVCYSDNKDTLLIQDIGNWSSKITDTAISMIDLAQSSVWVTENRALDPKIIRSLHNSSKRGIEIVYVNPTNRQICGHKSKISEHHLVDSSHARVLIVDGSCVLFGSHNLSPFSSLFRTQEMNIKTRNLSIVKCWQEYFKYLVSCSTRFFSSDSHLLDGFMVSRHI